MMAVVLSLTTRPPARLLAGLLGDDNRVLAKGYLLRAPDPDDEHGVGASCTCDR
jgi:hypothetical protein